MLFNSSEFLLFFPAVVILFFAIPHKFRWAWLLLASCFFYMFFKPEYILILAFTIIIDYYAGIMIEKSTDLKSRKKYLVMSLFANIGVLAIFKYYNFINGNITGLAVLFHLKNEIPYLSMILPIGLSFHTFQAMSYTFEVYRGKQKAEQHFGIYALYVMFFPQLVAGPIERPQNILHQFHAEKSFNYENALIGLKLIAFGLFKKVVVADKLAPYVDQVYGHLKSSSQLSVITAVIFFAFQIYADFSGYTDIARGTAKVMGFDLVQNFNEPFASRSISDFWRRWHMSLSTWFNDYLFTPMLISFRNFEAFGIILAVMITFFISGLWHGAGWSFIMYGVVNGIAVCYEISTKKIRKKLFSRLHPLVNTIITRFCVLSFIILSWILFRSENLLKAGQVFHKIFEFSEHWKIDQFYNGNPSIKFYNSFFVIILLSLFSALFKKLSIRFDLYLLIIITITIIYFGNNETAQFIYFQF